MPELHARAQKNSETCQNYTQEHKKNSETRQNYMQEQKKF